ncbi:MAG: hypothetical protein AB1714_27820 [Acidobacteriota bacterium]
MKKVLWLLTILGIVALLAGAVERFVGTFCMFSPQGYWRGAVAFWLLAITLKMLYEEKK